MSQVKLHLQSFNAGELAPTMGSRFGVEKVATGCRRLRNMLPHVHGPVFKRPGLEWLGKAGSDGERSRLVGFNFSTTTRFILELHPLGLRVWSNGELVTLVNPVAWPYSESETAEVQMVQVNDVVFLAHPNHPPRKLTRRADDDWDLREVEWKYPALLDEYVRSDLALPPILTNLLQIPAQLWPETGFHGTAGATYWFVVNWQGGGGTKTVNLQRWTGSAWSTIKTFSFTATTYNAEWQYTTPSPASPQNVRITFSGGEATTSGTARYEQRAGVSVVELISLDLTIPQPTSDREVTVPIGDWQVTADGVGAPQAVPAGSSCKVQRWNGSSWVDVTTLTLTPEKVTVFTGTTLVATQRTRLKWAGDAWTGAVIRVERKEYPSSTDITLTINATSGTGRTLTASQALFEPGHVGSWWQIAHRRDTGLIELAPGATWSAQNSSAMRVIGRWDFFTYGTWHGTVHLERQTPSGGWETVRSWASKGDRNVVATGTEDAECSLRLRLSASTASGTNPRFVLEAADSKVYGLVKVTDIGTLVDGKSTTATVDVVRDVFATTATTFWTEGAFSAAQGYPRAVVLHGARLWWCGTLRQPSRLWGSVVNDYEDMRRSLLDDGGVSFTPQSEQSHPINWLASQGREMLMGTAGDEWIMTSEGPIVTPTDASFRRQSSFGGAYQQALVINEAVIWAQRGGRRLRRVNPRSDGDPWGVSELTVLAEHVTAGGIRQMAFMSNPMSILWAVTNEGKLIGMTYEKEQNVFAWHVHETPSGTIESVAVIYGGETDEVWVTARRVNLVPPEFEAPYNYVGEWTVGYVASLTNDVVLKDGLFYASLIDDNAETPGASTNWDLLAAELVENVQRSVERLDVEALAKTTDRKRHIYLDGATREDFEVQFPVMTGLDRFNGQRVRMVADGVEVFPTPGDTSLLWLVVSGQVSPPENARVVIVGQAFEAEVQPMRIDVPMGDGTSQARRFRVSRVGAEVIESFPGPTVADGLDGTFEALPITGEAFSGMAEVAIRARTADAVNVCVKDSAPYPFMLGGLVLKMDVYGD